MIMVVIRVILGSFVKCGFDISVSDVQGLTSLTEMSKSKANISSLALGIMAFALDLVALLGLFVFYLFV